MTSPPRTPRAVRSPYLDEVAAGVYAYVQPDGSWWINNTGFVVGDEAIIGIDACATAARTAAYREAIASVSTLEVRTLVNTHHHGDHTNGNYQFADATVVGHRNCRTEMLAFGLPGEQVAQTWVVPDWGPLELKAPSLTFDDELVLWTGDCHCEVRFAGTAAHSTSDSIVWLPDQSILFAGDLLFKGGSPYVLGGSLRGAIAAAEALAELHPRTIIPGHGSICGPDVIDDVLGYLRFVEDLARRASAADVSPLEAALESDLGDYAGLLDSERIVANLHRAHSELRGTPLDRGAALRDMVTYHGGRLPCRA